MQHFLNRASVKQEGQFGPGSFFSLKEAKPFVSAHRFIPEKLSVGSVMVMECITGQLKCQFNEMDCNKVGVLTYIRIFVRWEMSWERLHCLSSCNMS